MRYYFKNIHMQYVCGVVCACTANIPRGLRKSNVAGATKIRKWI